MPRLFAALPAIAVSLMLALSTVAPLAHAAGDGLMREDGIHMETWMHVSGHDLKMALKAADASGKSMVVIFEQPGCHTCAQMHSENFSDVDFVTALTADFDVHLMSTRADFPMKDRAGEPTTEEEYANENLVQGTPTIIFYAADGTETFRMPGLLPRPYFRAAFDYMRESGDKSLTDFRNWIAANMDMIAAKYGG